MRHKNNYRNIEEAVIFRQAVFEQPLLFRIADTLISVFCRPAPGKETENEDCIALIPAGNDVVIIAVADGVGGLPQGAAASELALQMVSDCVARAHSPREGILEGIEQANQAILDSSINFATTFAAVEIEGHSMRTYHVGDSGALLTGQRGLLKLQTTAHSPTGYGIEAGYLNDMTAIQHEERNIVSNVVGSGDMHIAIGTPTPIAPRDTGLVASDGLFDNLLPREIIDTIRCGKLFDATQTLVDFATERMTTSDSKLPGHPDDLSLALFRKAR